MASKYNAKFEKDMAKFVVSASDNMQEVRNLAVYALFCSVVDRTPVWFVGTEHAGTAKWNWTVTFGAPSGRVLKGKDTTGKTTKSRGYAKLKKEHTDQDIYISNSVPYIFKIENGGYPDPSGGSRNPKTGETVIRSIGGYSTQSPYGMAKISALEWVSHVNYASRKVK